MNQRAKTYRKLHDIPEDTSRVTGGSESERVVVNDLNIASTTVMVHAVFARCACL